MAGQRRAFPASLRVAETKGGIDVTSRGLKSHGSHQEVTPWLGCAAGFLPLLHVPPGLGWGVAAL